MCIPPSNSQPPPSPPPPPQKKRKKKKKEKNTPHWFVDPVPDSEAKTILCRAAHPHIAHMLEYPTPLHPRVWPCCSLVSMSSSPTPASPEESPSLITTLIIVITIINSWWIQAVAFILIFHGHRPRFRSPSVCTTVVGWGIRQSPRPFLRPSLFTHQPCNPIDQHSVEPCHLPRRLWPCCERWSGHWLWHPGWLAGLQCLLLPITARCAWIPGVCAFKSVGHSFSFGGEKF